MRAEGAPPPSRARADARGRTRARARREASGGRGACLLSAVRLVQHVGRVVGIEQQEVLGVVVVEAVVVVVGRRVVPRRAVVRHVVVAVDVQLRVVDGAVVGLVVVAVGLAVPFVRLGVRGRVVVAVIRGRALVVGARGRAPVVARARGRAAVVGAPRRAAAVGAHDRALRARAARARGVVVLRLRRGEAMRRRGLPRALGHGLALPFREHRARLGREQGARGFASALHGEDGGGAEHDAEPERGGHPAAGLADREVRPASHPRKRGEDARR